MQVLCLSLAFLSTLGIPARASALQEQPDGSYGFDGQLVFKFNRDVGPLAIADLDGDGRQDLVVIDNSKSEIVFLYQDPNAKGESAGHPRLMNPDGYRRQTLLVNSRVQCLRIADLDADGRVDLLLHSPGLLEIRWGAGTESFQKKDRVRLADTVAGGQVVQVRRTVKGELEVFVLARKGVFRLTDFSQSHAPKQQLFPGSSGKPQALFLTDLDGDGGADLLSITDDREFPYHLRLRQGDDAFGPQYMMNANTPMAVAALARTGGDAILIAEREHGRFSELHLHLDERSDPLDLEAPEIYPLDSSGLEEPQLVVADIDGDQDPDVMVTNRKESTILVYVNEGGKLVAAPPSPTLRSLVGIAQTDLDGDGKPELVVTSAEERVVGSTQLGAADKSASPAAVTLQFPRVLVSEGKPALATPGRFSPDTKQISVAVLGGEKGRTIQIYSRSAAGTWQVADGTEPLELTSSGDPKDLVAADLDGDGRDELLFYFSFEVPQIYRLDGARWNRIDAPGVLEKTTMASVTRAPGGDLFVASGNHARRLKLREGKFEVQYQVNGASASARIVCALEARLTRDDDPHLLLVNTADGSLNIFRGASSSQPELVRSVVGPYQQILAGKAADLDGDGIDEVLLLDASFLAVLRGVGAEPRLDSKFTRTNPRDEGNYVSIAFGDLNNDKRTDLVVSDGAKHFIEIYQRANDDDWQLALSFPVYESNSFRGQSGAQQEPRALAVGDVTGDGFEDLILIVHDRVLIYPQEPLR
ncbi:MAG: FG-GAP repeat domain-containing protein [Planctomycetota bacterium]